MLTLTIPAQERRVWLRSFWFTLCGLCAGPALALAWWRGSLTLAVVAAACTLAACALVLVQDGPAWALYRAWNPRVVRPFGALVGAVATRACFWVVTAAGAAGRDGREAGPDTAWATRDSLQPAAYGSLFAGRSATPTSGSWVWDYVVWAVRSGRPWALALLPFLLVLSALPRETRSAAQQNIYTLF